MMHMSNTIFQAFPPLLQWFRCEAMGRAGRSSSRDATNTARMPKENLWIYGGFHSHGGNSWMVSFMENPIYKNDFKWMIWEYPHFRKAPYSNL